MGKIAPPPTLVWIRLWQSFVCSVPPSPTPVHYDFDMKKVLDIFRNNLFFHLPPLLPHLLIIIESIGGLSLDSDLHCEKLVGFLEIKVTKVWKPLNCGAK